MGRWTPMIAACMLTVALAGCSAAASGSGSGTAASTADGATLVSTRCTRCHGLPRIKAAQHDAAGWAATVARMRGKGAQLTDAEAQEVVDFLAGGGASGL